MIILSKLTQDAVNGTLIVSENINSGSYDGQARVSRSRTLDGGVVIDHRGVIDGDRTILISCSLSEADEAIARTLFENETIIHVSTKDGFYSGAIERLKSDDGKIEMQILLKEVV